MVADDRHCCLLFTFAVLYVITVVVYSLRCFELRTLVIHSIIEFDCLNLLLNGQIVLDLRSDVRSLFHCHILVLPVRWHRARFSNVSHFWRISVCEAWVGTSVIWRKIVDGDVLIYDLAWILVVLTLVDEIKIVTAVAAEGCSSLRLRIRCELQRHIVIIRPNVFERTFSFDSLYFLLGARRDASGSQWSS